jgi:hypothetical protein
MTISHLLTKRTIAFLLILPATLIIASLFWFNSGPKACPLPDYSWYHGYADDLLILKGNCVVPTAIEAIQDRRLPKRPHFMFF